MTQLQAARSGVVTEAMEIVAADEGVGRETVRAAVASGEAVIPRNVHHTNAHPVGVGRMFTTKINANLGRSATHSGKGDELKKLKIALDCKADFVMDLSVGSDDHWDEVMDILAEHDVTVSLGDGLRPGCLADASDDAQFGELDVLGELVDRCRARGLQVMVEGPGHVPFNQIRMNMERQQKVCKKAPFYVLGPVTTDIAPGYDHVASSIGAAAAATYGASLLCSVTPAEHLGLPDGEEVRQGCVVYKIAAHAGDVARGLKGARDRDDAMARARAEFDWDRQFSHCLDPERAKSRWSRTRAFTDEAHGDDHCSMCGKQFCAVRTSRRIRKLAERMKGEMK